MSRIVVISSDAQVGEDLGYLSTKPNFRKFLAGGACIRNVRSIYPSVTFPAHATMITGCYPEHHGVTSNSQFPAFPDPVPWTWFASFLQCEDIFHLAKRAGKTTASVLWPVTAGNPAIDYHIADYWAQNGESEEAAFAATGSSSAVLDIVRKNAYLAGEDWRIHPQRDEFGIACARDMILEFAPEVLFVHPANIDAVRHEKGVFGPHVDVALDSLDRWIGMLGSALLERGVLDETDLFLVSDHGQMDVRRAIGLNVLFAEHGWLSVGEDGMVRDWRAYCLSNGMSCLVYVKDPADVAQVRRFLDDLLAEGLYGFSRIFSEREARETEHLGGEFSFVLETDGYTAFGDYATRPLVRPLDNHDYRFGRATHGYLPENGPQPMLVAKGPHIRKHAVLDGSCIVDEAPTFARILGVSFPHADGTAIDGILRSVRREGE